MQREIFTTRDGSHSISIPEMNVMYHSIHGALQESMHVFIHTGLHYAREVFPEGPLEVLEVGFGTGLNALLTVRESLISHIPIVYTTLEQFPLEMEKAKSLNYPSLMESSPDYENYFDRLHASEWEKEVEICRRFVIHKKKTNLLEFSSPSKFHAIYFDAFAPTAQPELWTADVFTRLYDSLSPSGILVTYCSKSVVRRAMEAAGFKVTKPVGPWGKREMIRAIK